MGVLRTRAGGQRRRDEREKKDELKELRSRRRTGPGVVRRNSSLVKGAIIQRIAPGPQTAHKLWAFNFAILTGRSDEWQGEGAILGAARDSLGPPRYFSFFLRSFLPSFLQSRANLFRSRFTNRTFYSLRINALINYTGAVVTKAAKRN